MSLKKQPNPTPNKPNLPDCWDLVMQDMKDRQQHGRDTYGMNLQPFNGRSNLQDAYEEVLDLAVYLRTKLCEEELEKQRLEQRPKIVCLCGSTRFFETFQQTSLSETLAGNIVLSIGYAKESDDVTFPDPVEREKIKERLDELHKRKIDLADEVYVLDVCGYIGSSTRSEIDYATNLKKPIRYYSKENRSE